MQQRFDARNLIPIVGVGASAGGLDAFKSFFAAMPPDQGMAFVLVQHLDPAHESMMVDLLTRHTEMPVIQVEDRMKVQVNHVYMIPPNRYLKISQGELLLSEPTERRGMRMEIDTFLHSLAEDQHERAIGIILTGTGSDGSAGMKAIKAHGGLALVQDPESAAHDGMPRSAIATDIIDDVLPIKQMPDILIRYTQHLLLSSKGCDSVFSEPAQDHLHAVLALLQTRLGLDFRQYKQSTLVRRIERRMELNQTETANDYLQLLRKRTEELERLCKDLMLGVTSFFRDPESFAALEAHAIRELVTQVKNDNILRIWVPGCATGEEAYTIAMLFLDELQQQGKKFKVKLFASDINQSALDTARTGIYPASIAVDVPSERLQRYFSKIDDDRFEINKILRESVVFAQQNLTADPPFSRLDLISCRNLLIYLKAPTQQRLISLFHFALKPSGYLMLGDNENLGKHGDLFEVISKKWRIYRCLRSLHPRPADFPNDPQLQCRASRTAPSTATATTAPVRTGESLAGGDLCTGVCGGEP